MFYVVTSIEEGINAAVEANRKSSEGMKSHIQLIIASHYQNVLMIDIDNSIEGCMNAAVEANGKLSEDMESYYIKLPECIHD